MAELKTKQHDGDVFEEEIVNLKVKCNKAPTL